MPSRLPSVQVLEQAAAARPLVSDRLPSPPSRRKQSQDTVAGCNERAAADLAQASMIATANGRKRLETSAAAWTERADLLQRIQSSFEKRKALDAAEWQRQDDAESQDDQDGQSEQHHGRS